MSVKLTLPQQIKLCNSLDQKLSKFREMGVTRIHSVDLLPTFEKFLEEIPAAPLTQAEHNRFPKGRYLWVT